MSPLVALTRDDIATYVSALFTVYFILIIVRIILSWVQQFRPLPYNMALRAAIGFIEESVDPILGDGDRGSERAEQGDQLVREVVLHVLRGDITEDAPPHLGGLVGHHPQNRDAGERLG